MRGLADECAVLIEHIRPGPMAGFGPALETLIERNPKLIVLRVSRYGQAAPNLDNPGFGIDAAATGGLRHLDGAPVQVPVRMSVSIGVTLAALLGVSGIQLALQRPLRAGRRQRQQPLRAADGGDRAVGGCAH